jgi:hypothetical protein
MTAALAPSRRRAQWRLKSSRTRGDPRPALPVLHLRRGEREGDVGVAVAQRPRDVGEAGAEGERVHLQVAPGQAVHVVQHEPGVAVHRARDVEQHDERRQLGARLAEARHQRARLARHRQHGAAAGRSGRARSPRAAPPHRRERQRQLLGDALGELELGRGHRLEVGALQPLAVGER